jgi:hypothetical protein
MTIGVIVAIVVIVAVAAAAAIEYNRRKRRAEFGPEYDVLVEQEGGRRAADREISRRRRAYSQLELRPLPPEERARHPEDWRRVQESFVDDPAAALSSADALVLRLARTRGYPSGGEELIELLSIPHTGAVTGYREAIRVREAAERDPHSVSTEEMRQAFQGYGAMFEDLLAAADTDAGAQSARDSDVREPVGVEERR